MEFHLAPMKDVTCWAFRTTSIGATDSYTEMISLKELLLNKERAWSVVDTYPINSQRQWVQVLTSSLKEMELLPSRLKQFCSDNTDRAHIYGVNVNASCPDLKIISEGAGAALIKRTKRLKDLIIAFLGPKESHEFRISCKLRLGLNAKEMRDKKVNNFLEAISTLEDPRISPSIIHFKHAKKKSQAMPDWEYLEPALDSNVPIIINGNITNSSDLIKIKKALSSKNQQLWNKLISGIMIGRAAINNPFCFQNFQQKFHEKTDIWQEVLNKSLEEHPPQPRFISTIKSLHPNFFKEI